MFYSLTFGQMEGASSEHICEKIEVSYNIRPSSFHHLLKCLDVELRKLSFILIRRIPTCWMIGYLVNSVQRKKLLKCPSEVSSNLQSESMWVSRSAKVSLPVTNVDDSNWLIIFRDIEKNQLSWSQFSEDSTDKEMMSSRKEIPACDTEKLKDMMCNRKIKCLKNNWTSKRRRIQFHRKSV